MTRATNHQEEARTRQKELDHFLSSREGKIKLKVEGLRRSFRLTPQRQTEKSGIQPIELHGKEGKWGNPFGTVQVGEKLLHVIHFHDVGTRQYERLKNVGDGLARHMRLTARHVVSKRSG